MILAENPHGSGRFEKKAIKNSKIVFFQTFSSAFFEILSYIFGDFHFFDFLKIMRDLDFEI